MGRKYNNPPIIEAIGEFQFTSDPDWDLAIPGLIYERLRDSFPKRRQVKAFEATIAAGGQGVQQQLVEKDRLQLLRDDEKALVQVSPHLLAVNHLKPYPTWEGFLPIIQEALEAYREVAKPKGLQRIGLRYINKIDFAESRVELEEYFNFYPFVGKELPEDFGPFIVGIQVPYEDSRDVLRLQMTSAKPDKPKTVSVLLDLDYFLTRPGEVAFEEVSVWLDQSHNRIEAAFEGSLTNNLRKRFEEVQT